MSRTEQKRKITLKHRLEFFLIRFADITLSGMKVYHRRRLSVIIGLLVYYFIPIRKKVARDNIKRAFPDFPEKEVRKIIKKAYVHFTFLIVDGFSLYRNMPSHFNSRVVIRHPEIAETVLKTGKGCLIVTAHFGSWEAFGSWFPFNGYRFAAILKRQKNPLAHQYFYDIRRKIGMELILTSAPSSELINYLNQGYFIGIVSDQDAGKKGVFVPFFGIPASTPVGTAVYALRKRVPIIAGLAFLDSHCKYNMILHRIDYSDIRELNTENIREITLRYTRVFESVIRKYPEQYFWFHKRWKTKEKR